MDTTEHKQWIQAGRVIAALGNEERFWSSVKGLSLDEQVSAVMGFMDGLVARQGLTPGWPKALTIMEGYRPIEGSQKILELYLGERDGKEVREGYPALILERLRIEKGVTEARLDPNACGSVSRLFSEHQFNELIKIGAIRYDSAENVLDLKPMPARTSAYSFLGDRAFYEGDDSMAMRYFCLAESTIGMGMVCDRVKKKPTLDGLRLLADAVWEHSGFRKTYLADVVRIALEAKVDRAADTSVLGSFLMNVLRNQPGLPEGMLDALIARASPYLAHNDIEHCVERKDVRLLWAKAHVKDSPATAYRLFRVDGYQGQERIEAARRGLVNGMRRYDGFEEDRKPMAFEDVEMEDVEAVFKKMKRVPVSLEIEMERYFRDGIGLQRIAKRLFAQYERETRVNGQEKPGKRMRGDSIESAREGGDHGESRIRTPDEKLRLAYNLWREGNGEEGEFIKTIREKIIARSMAESKRTKTQMFIACFDQSDNAGHARLYNVLLDDHPFEAYIVSRRMGDSRRRLEALQRMVRMDPEAALKEVHQHGSTEERFLALDAVGVKYQIPTHVLKRVQDGGMA